MALRLADGRGMGGNPGAHRVPVDDQPVVDDDEVDDHGSVIELAIRIRICLLVYAHNSHNQNR